MEQVRGSILARKKPPSRRVMARSASNDARRLVEPAPPVGARNALMAKATLGPYSKHKKNPHAYGLKSYTGADEDPSYCDEHAGFGPEDMPRAKGLLDRGIDAGLFGGAPKKGDPGLLWSVDDNGWIYEAQVTNPGYSVYHAYPVLPGEAIARKVLLRYADYVRGGHANLQNSLAQAQARYAR